MEQLIVKSIIQIERIERKYGRLGTLIGILLLLVVGASALFALAGISIAWFKATDWILRTFFGFGL